MESHKPPRFDTYGNQIHYTEPAVLPEVKLRPDWIHEPKTRTLGDIKEQLRQERLGHPTFDLDGDGVIGGHDFMLASRFDEDKDGRLNTAELANAKRALEGGYSDQFLWGCDRSGTKRPFRIVQVRGKIINDECFGAVGATYPEVQRPTPRHRTKEALDDFRKGQTKAKASEIAAEWEKKWPQRVPNKFTPWEGYVQSPKYKSLKEVRKERRNTCRLQQGLTEEEEEVVQLSKYVENPTTRMRTDLESRRKSELVSSR
jgi:hypothetical protein